MQKQQKIQRQLQQTPLDQKYNPEKVLDKIFDFQEEELKKVAIWNMKNIPEFELMVNELLFRQLPKKIGVSYSNDDAGFSGLIIKLPIRPTDYMFLNDGNLHMLNLNSLLSHEVAHANEFYTKILTRDVLNNNLKNNSKLKNPKSLDEVIIKIHQSRTSSENDTENYAILRGDKATAAALGLNAYREHYNSNYYYYIQNFNSNEFELNPELKKIYNGRISE